MYAVFWPEMKIPSFSLSEVLSVKHLKAVMSRHTFQEARKAGAAVIAVWNRVNAVTLTLQLC